ncbi:MAG TPA: hypothetical protein VKD66_07975 [Streptosporangiaceae bacterium]|jgi:hypothetical protein|nr:hypothetical protein [Streptosporangiaceae bacterium]
MDSDERPRVPAWKTSSDLDLPRRRSRSATLIAYLIIVSWPLLFWPLQSQLGTRWLPGLAIPWWIMVGGVALLVTIARAVMRTRKEPPAIHR